MSMRDVVAEIDTAVSQYPRHFHYCKIFYNVAHMQVYSHANTFDRIHALMMLTIS